MGIKVKPKKKVVKGKNPKNKNILNTKIKNIPKSLVKKTKQKIKNAKNSTPGQLAKKIGKNLLDVYTAPFRAVKKRVVKAKRKKDAKNNPPTKMAKLKVKKMGVGRGGPSRMPRVYKRS